MTGAQSEPFHLVLRHLRDQLQRGDVLPGSRITAVDLADELRLSTTPVREALSRLAGEGLLEDRRGQGYFVRLLSAADIADLYRMSLAHLLIALDPGRPRRVIAAGVDPPFDPKRPEEAIAQMEALFHRWVVATGSRLLTRSFRILQIQLGPVRRLEGRILEDLPAEALRLLAIETDGSPGERLAELRQFHAIRIREAEQLAAALEGRAAGLGK